MSGTSTLAGAERAGRRPHVGLPRVPALDGLRGVAVAGVVIYHLGAEWLPGGFLGVSLFFTLSGFLITSLVRAEHRATGTVDRRAFWGRRFRRLLPAAWAGLAVAITYAAFAGDADQLRNLPGDITSALAEVANWHFIFSGSHYAAGYQAPSPVLHYWSLAIEEQFYLLFPLAVAVLVARRATRKGWLATFGVATVASMVLMVVLYDPTDSSRVYFNTFTRAAELLAGVLLALALDHWSHPTPTPIPPSELLLDSGSSATNATKVGGGWPRWVVPMTSVVAVAFTGFGWATAHADSEWLYRGGLWLTALASCGLIVAALHGGVLATALSWRPLMALGAVSYGVYVYHWPLFLWISTEHTGLEGLPLVVARLAATFALALLSYRFLEGPIRRERIHLSPITVAGIVAAALLVLAGAFAVGSRADARAVADVEAAEGGRTLVTRPPQAGATGDQADATPGTVPVAPPTRVLFLGDSLLHQAFPVIQDRFAADGIETKAIGGPGQNLLKQNGNAWRAELEAAVADWDPDVVVIESCCGHGDDKDPVTVEGVALDDNGDDVWAVWRDAASRAVDLAGARGARVAWVLAPPAQTNGYYGPIEGRIGRANDIALGLQADHPDLEYVDWRVLAAPDGSFTADLPDADGKLVTVRAFDGLHFTPAGQGVLADVTLEQVLAAWRIGGGRTAPSAAPPGTDVPGSVPGGPATTRR